MFVVGCTVGCTCALEGWCLLEVIIDGYYYFSYLVIFLLRHMFVCVSGLLVFGNVLLDLPVLLCYRNALVLLISYGFYLDILLDFLFLDF